MSSVETENLVDRWVTVNDLPLFYRTSREPVTTGRVPIIHIHGFAISGTYLLPTADLLAKEFPTYVPDLPGYGRSHDDGHTLTIPELGNAIADFMDAMDIERAVLVGNSMGCPAILEFNKSHHERLIAAVLCSPAGGYYNQPLRKGVLQIMRDAIHEPLRIAPVAVGDYLRFGLIPTAQLAKELFSYPTADAFHALDVPAMAVVGSKDPLVDQDAFKERAAEVPHLSAVGVEGSAHAINFSHPGELANLVREFLSMRRLIDDPGSEGDAEMVQRGNRLIAAAGNSLDIASP